LKYISRLPMNIPSPGVFFDVTDGCIRLTFLGILVNVIPRLSPIVGLTIGTLTTVKKSRREDSDMSVRNFMEMLKVQWNRGKFVCVGLDSDYETICQSSPHASSPDARVRWPSVSATLANFNRSRVEATNDIVCSYKLNSAFYEAYGPEGIEGLHQTIVHIRAVAPGVPIIIDAKRADIGNSNKGYVRMAFDYLQADAVTVHPYLGAEALQPFLDRKDKGVIVLCRTSNPGAGEFQDRRVILTFGEFAALVGDRVKANDLNGVMGWWSPTGDYRIPIYQYLAVLVARKWNKNGNCALVVGATYPEELREVRKIVGDMPILIPGVGAQGGNVEEVVSAGKNSRGQGMIINSSRGSIDNPDPRKATIELHDLINQSLKPTK
jgi:orotidine-5'-phosphate decarboxylase